MPDRTRDRQARQRRDLAGARQALAEHPREAGPEERQGQAGHDLVGPEVDGHDAVEQAEQAAGEHRHDDARATGCRSSAVDREAGDRAMSIIPSTPRLRTPRPLGEDLADRREQQDRPARDAGGQDRGRVHQAVASRRSKRTR